VRNNIDFLRYLLTFVLINIHSQVRQPLPLAAKRSNQHAGGRQ